MKKIYIYIIISFYSLTCGFCYGQNSVKFKLIYKSSDINKPSKDDLDIKRVRHAIFSDSVIVTLKNKKKLILSQDKIWGYQNDEGTLFRCYDGEFFKLRQQDTLFIYSQACGKSTDYYFSKGVDGKILGINWKNLKKQFADNTCFLNKIDNELKWYQDYSSYNSKTKSYRIIEFFKTCLDNPRKDKTQN